MALTDSPRHQTIRHSFEGFNLYAQRAQERGNDNADVDAMLAVAFEISQLRYHLRQVFDNRKEVTSNG